MYYSTKEMKIKKIKKKLNKKPACRAMKMFPCKGKPTINFPWPNYIYRNTNCNTKLIVLTISVPND
jgi:hypothetical protein